MEGMGIRVSTVSHDLFGYAQGSLSPQERELGRLYI